MTSALPFRDRAEAGRALAARLVERYGGRDDVVVLGLPRGGVPVAFEVARSLHAPLDAFMVRKLGVPGHPELAMGAIATGGVEVLNEHVVSHLEIPPEEIDAVAERERRELARRTLAFRGDRPEPRVASKTVILVDDGLATGSTMRAAVKALRRLAPARIVVAVPIGSAETCAELGAEGSEVVCAETPDPFFQVGQGYEDFRPTSDEEVRSLLDLAAEPSKAAP